jgi:hypothetical protein
MHLVFGILGAWRAGRRRRRSSAPANSAPAAGRIPTVTAAQFMPNVGDVNAARVGIDLLHKEIAYQRPRLRQVWKKQTAGVVQAEERLKAVEVTRADGTLALEMLMTNSTFYYAPSPVSVDRDDLTSILVRDGSGTWVVNESIEARLESNLRQAISEIHNAERRSLRHRAQVRATGLLDEYRRTLAMLEGAREQLLQDRARAIEARTREAVAARMEADASLAMASDLTRRVLLRMPPSMQPWSSAIWQDDWTQFRTIVWPAQMFVGTLTPTPDAELGDNFDFGVGESIPLVFSPSENLHLLHDSTNREEALALVRSLLLRSLVAIQPGRLDFSFFDPMARGLSVAGQLADLDPVQIERKVWTTQSELSEGLAEQIAHTEYVMQKYLRSTFSTIDDFNAAAGEMAEAYRLLVILDFPTGFNEELYAGLRRVIENGPRCGIRTLLVSNLDEPLPFGVALSTRIRQMVMAAPFSFEHNGYVLELTFWPDSDLAVGDHLMKSIVDTIGHESAN